MKVTVRGRWDDEGRAHAFAFAPTSRARWDREFCVAFAKRWPAFARPFRAAKVQLGDVFVWSAGDNVFVYAARPSVGGPEAEALHVDSSARRDVARATQMG